MRIRIIAVLIPLATLAGIITLSLTSGQNPPLQPPGPPPPPLVFPPQAGPPLTPVTPAQPSTTAPEQARPLVSGLTPAAPQADPLSKMSLLHRQMYICAQSGADWLFRSNRPDGKFEYGFQPSLNAKLDGNLYLHQAGAAFALARAARLTGDERHAAVARQAVLTLLLDTTTEKAAVEGGIIRHTTLPSTIINRLGAAGLLVLAINELPNPADDLLDQSEELCRFIRLQQQADGSLALSDTPSDSKPKASDPEGINYFPGVALHGLMRSQQYRPAAWKTEAVKKALAYYQPWWVNNRNLAFIACQTAANAEAFVRSEGKEKAHAEFVFQMADWLLPLQYTQLDPRNPLWLGGFMNCSDGKPVVESPTITSACCAEALAEACRVAKQAGDLPRYTRYRESLERSLQFLSTLQYTDASTQHFADWYRPRLVGGFHASHQDGTLRIDYTQHAICALVQYLSYVAD